MPIIALRTLSTMTMRNARSSSSTKPCARLGGLIFSPPALHSLQVPIVGRRRSLDDGHRPTDADDDRRTDGGDP